MSKRRKIIIALCVLTVGVLTIGVLVIGALGYVLFSRKGGDTEVVFAPTEVGTPEGPNVTKDIGPAGGAIISPDGRLTLTVPQNALTETLPFSIQPITNKAGGGLGLAYRLEPNGKTFTTPLEISVRYGDGDLEGTVPEALSLAYQDGQGAWHLLNTAKLDQSAKTLTASTTHFTDWSFLEKLHIFPKKATVYVGETINVELLGCGSEDGVTRFRRFLGGRPGCNVSDGHYTWNIQENWFADIGTIDNPRSLSVLYTAPSKKPTPNVATVSLPYALQGRGDGEYLDVLHSGMFTAHITIVDRGYKAIGTSHDEVYSGVICDLEKPFTVNGSGLAKFTFKFVPSSPTEGEVSYSSSYSPGGAPAIESGSGSYTVKVIDTDKPRIVLTIDKATASVMGISVPPSKAGKVLINLTPAGPDECSRK
jgi:hypothetical protein